jgi:hypothetical protein
MVDPVGHLESWNDTATRERIVTFVQAVTDESSDAYVPPEDRIAAFDNDGTLWCEKPLPIQMVYVLRRLAEMAHEDSSLRTQQPWQAAYDGDHAWLSSVMDRHYAGDDSLLKVLMIGVLKGFAGMKVEEYVESARAFITGAPHPTLGRPLDACGYAPMVELLRYLEANGFTTMIASASDRDFMRAVSQQLYGVPPECVIGSSNALSWVEDDDGGSLVYLAEPDFFDDGPTKPIRIWSRVGRRPLIAGGNANGDIPMLAWSGGTRPALRLLVNHDDAEREFAYSAGAEAALQRAAVSGWTVISIRDDWSRVFDDR